MKILDLVSKIAILVILLVLSIGVNKLILIQKEAKFYEYNDSKINITQVKKVIPKMDYIITFKENNNIDVFRKYSKSLNEDEIARVKKLLSLAKKSEFYNVEIIAYMMLDDEKVVLYHSGHYLKHPTTYSVNEDLLSKLSAYGLDDFQYENLSKIKDVVYEDVNKFFDDVVDYAKIRRSNWSKENIPQLGLGANANKFMSRVDKKAEENPLGDEDIEPIIEELNSAYSHYLGIE